MSGLQAAAMPVEMLSVQLASVDLLLGMFYGEGEITLSDPAALDALREYVDTGVDASAQSTPLPSSIDLELNVEVSPDRVLELHIRIPLTQSEDSRTSAHHDIDPEEPPRPIYTLRCPSWLTRKEHAGLVASMPISDPDGVLGVVQYLKDTTLTQADTSDLNAPYTHTVMNSGAHIQPSTASEPLVRVWFYLQSLSTRSKRLDLVNWAPSYFLTGFVLAGKPGLLCLEGTSANISAYMSEIKTRSWSDVPAYQKKVSERCREEGEDVVRKFVGMREVTDEIGKGGKRGNRGEMAEVRALFESVGLEGMFEVVVGFGGGG